MPFGDGGSVTRRRVPDADRVGRGSVAHRCPNGPGGNGSGRIASAASQVSSSMMRHSGIGFVTMSFGSALRATRLPPCFFRITRPWMYMPLYGRCADRVSPQRADLDLGTLVRRSAVEDHRETLSGRVVGLEQRNARSSKDRARGEVDIMGEGHPEARGPTHEPRLSEARARSGTTLSAASSRRHSRAGRVRLPHQVARADGIAEPAVRSSHTCTWFVMASEAWRGPPTSSADAAPVGRIVPIARSNADGVR